MSDKISIKEIIDRLRREPARPKEQRACCVCKDAVVEIMKHSKNMADDIATLREMYETRIYKKRMKDGLMWTREDLEARIERNKCSIEKNWNRYNVCCKEGILPKEEQFRC